MGAERFVLLGLGQARAKWFSDVALWATSGSIPAEFSKCLSVAEVRQKLDSLRTFSALIVDSGVQGVDAELLRRASAKNVPVLVVESSARRAVNWTDEGAAAVLPAAFEPAELMAALTTTAATVRAMVTSDDLSPTSPAAGDISRGRLIAVCGPGGTGASTIAMALAQDLGRRSPSDVLLADMTRNAELAMLHDATDVSPGLPELVEANRFRKATATQARDATFWSSDRNYSILMGVRRRAAWTSMSVAAVLNSVDAITATFSDVVCDITADFEGEAESGSFDVEERNALARTCALEATTVVVVGIPGVKGAHALIRTVNDLIALGVSSDRIVTVVNRAPKSPIARHELSLAIKKLSSTSAAGIELTTVFVADRKAVEASLRDGRPLPKGISRDIVHFVDKCEVPVESEESAVTAITPGSLHVYAEASGQ